MHSFLTTNAICRVDNFAHTIIVINVICALNASHMDTPTLGKNFSLPFSNISLSQFAVFSRITLSS